MLRALTTWLYEEDPLALIAFDAPLEAVKSRLASNKSFFEEMLYHAFLNNPHRTTLLLKPDRELAKRHDAAERERLGDARRAMSSTELQMVISNTRELKRMQESPDSPEALATIPILRLSGESRFARSPCNHPHPPPE
jgi:Zn-dependent M16 (insulinase) family peptidase